MDGDEDDVPGLRLSEDELVLGEDEGEDEDAEDEPTWDEDDCEDGHHDEDDVPGLRMRMRMSSPGVRIRTHTRMRIAWINCRLSPFNTITRWHEKCVVWGMP